MKEASNTMASEELSERIFVYGQFRRDASEAFRLEGAKLIGKGWVEGSLYFIDTKPGLVSGHDVRRVRGEIYQLSSAQLRALDDSLTMTEDGDAGTGGGGYRRIQVQATLNGDPYDDTLWAWVYEWLGPMNDTLLVPTGDWMDIVRPPPPPVFTCAAWSLLVLPVGGYLIEQVSEAAHGVEWWMLFWWGTSALVVGAAVSLVIAERRGERARKAIIAGWIACAVWAFVQMIAGMGLLISARNSSAYSPTGMTTADTKATVFPRRTTYGTLAFPTR